jgi:hypothetical protein
MAAGVASVVSVGVLLLPESVDVEGAEFLLAALISLIGFAAARGAGASVLGALVYSFAVPASYRLPSVVKRLRKCWSVGGLPATRGRL